jgi:sugar phosphate isomerase/epimerase
MILRDQPPLHLAYCLNVHPGESWAEQFTAIREKAMLVRDRVCPGKAFGLGLRISHRAAVELSSSAALRNEARDYFSANGLLPFTINGFPYGRFHRQRVKEQVYAPDWRSAERRDYTMLLAGLLAEWLPMAGEGSISTVPLSFKAWITSAAEQEQMARHLIECAMHLAKIEADTGREIHLGLEPEPACLLETASEAIHFFHDVLFPLAGGDEPLVRRHVGVCFDTCHAAMQFEDLRESWDSLQSAGLRISKLQLSSALRIPGTGAALEALRPFCEPVYLHQVNAREPGGAIRSWRDLPDALDELSPGDAEELRIHFHVPLFFEKHGEIESTGISAAFLAHAFQTAATAHWEIETYTFDVLPEHLRAPDVIESIAREYRWLLDSAEGFIPRSAPDAASR